MKIYFKCLFIESNKVSNATVMIRLQKGTCSRDFLWRVMALEVDIAFYQLYWLWACPKACEIHYTIWKLAGIWFQIVAVCRINSLAPGKFEWNFRYGIFKWILLIDGWGISCEIALIWMSLVFTDDQSTLVQVMAWCRQATSHYLSQCWLSSSSPYGVAGSQWVDTFKSKQLAFRPRGESI